MSHVYKFRAYLKYPSIFIRGHCQAEHMFYSDKYASLAEFFSALDMEPETDIATMQYTRGHEKDHVEIYEDDIMEYPATAAHDAGRCVIEYDQDQCKYVGMREGYASNIGMAWLSEYGKIIGNIYENPELLEQPQ